MFAFLRDINRRKRSEALLLARQRLSELAERVTTDRLMQAALDEAELFTESRIGFFHFVSSDQESVSLQAWSTNTLEHMCQAQGHGEHYPIREAGVWADCVEDRAPVIHNDYARLAHRKGLPEGHAPVERELVVPVLRDGLIVAIFGVGNKTTDYSEEDVETVQAVADLVMDIVARKRAEEALRASLQEKELMLREIHHRVKNNLQLVSSLVNLQSSQSRDSVVQTALTETQGRIRALALLHESLYRFGDLARLNLAEFIDGLVAQVQRSAGPMSERIRIEQRIEPVLLEIDQAVPCGLIINELLTNCVKHAFPDGRAGTVHVEVTQRGPHRVTMSVSDDGVGFPVGAHPSRAGSLGFQLISDLATQLRGEYRILDGPGAGIEINFPVSSSH